MNKSDLDQIFSALADSTRRGMLARLAEGETNITELAKPFNMSQPAISKHLRVLERAGLIERERRGREHYIRAAAAPAERASGWITHYARIWKLQFAAVEEILKEKGEIADVNRNQL